MLALDPSSLLTLANLGIVSAPPYVDLSEVVVIADTKSKRTYGCPHGNLNMPK